jgi:aldehyde dehydrogenase (NAD+)
MTIAKEEIFGPVLSVLKFKDVDEVIARANNSQYGLVGSVFSSNMAVCNKVANGLEAGVVNVNNYFQLDCDTPFGGYK